MKRIVQSAFFALLTIVATVIVLISIGVYAYSFLKKDPAYFKRPPIIARPNTGIGQLNDDAGWKALALEGRSDAQHEQCLAHGIKNDVDRNYYKKIVLWCQEDAEEGALKSEYLLGKLYAGGQVGFTQNWEDAYFWYSLQTADTTKDRDDAVQHLTVEQIKSVNERIVEWKANFCATSPQKSMKTKFDWNHHCTTDTTNTPPP